MKFYEMPCKRCGSRNIRVIERQWAYIYCHCNTCNYDYSYSIYEHDTVVKRLERLGYDYL